MVEIAISLAVIGIALVAIVGVLPLGMNVQKENREATVINQDATVFIEAIRNGAHGLDDLTNYVFLITNFVTQYKNSTPQTPTLYGYTYTGSTLNGAPMSPSLPINNGTNIVGLLSTPEFTNPTNGAPSDNVAIFINGNYNSNHIVAYVRSISGPAVEKPPQDNPILQSDSFSYRLLCVNAPVASYTPPLWLRQSYNVGDTVSYILNGQTTYWQAIFAGNPANSPQPGDVPDGSSVRWARAAYAEQLAANLHELRLTFLWPQQPNGNVGSGRQTYRALIAGQVATSIVNGNYLYFYQPQSFGSAQ